MGDFPDMPADFWPDEVLVVAKYKNSELAFAITANAFQQKRAATELEPNLDGLRMALWQSENLHAEDSK